ncbi:phosphotransferase family protein [Azoarcus sp. DN11]|uniref:phosphotransferase family protein n=1 Tax=Azoarcus sp. DN11 TaxID=356837 RepID=UPI0013E3EAF6|nr:phosphotransferase family protein [Azoarcus sp. DN11]
MKERLQAYLSQHIPDARSVVVERLEPILGGASRMTYYLGYRYHWSDEQSQRAVLRMVPETGGFTSEGMAKEVKIFEALRATGIPVPRALFWSDDPKWLGSAFVIMEEVDGCESSLDGLTREPYVSMRKTIGVHFWTMLSDLAKLDPVALGLIDADDVPPLDQVWRLELEHAKEYRALAGCDNNLLLALLIRWLERNPPPPAPKLSVVHGDYRAGNFLYTEQGEIPLMLDWELWRLGDPIIDLMYSVRPTFQDKEGNAGRLIPVAEAIEIWKRNTGFAVSQESWKWYETAQRAQSYAMLARMLTEYFAGGGRETLTYFYALTSFTSSWPQLRQTLELPAPTVKRPSGETSPKGERIADYLRLAAKRYRGEYQQSIADGNTRKTLAIDGLILQVVADRVENGVFYYTQDNAELESVLRDAAESFATGALRERIDEVLSGQAASLRLSDLVERNDRLCATILAVLDAVESDLGTAARRIEALIRQAVSNQCERFVLPYNALQGL